MAVRYENTVRGLRDPLKWRPRLWRAYGYMKRQEGARERRAPTTVGVLRWIRTRAGDGDGGKAITAVTQLLWFYLLRIGEIVLGDHDDESTTDALRDSQLELRSHGHPVHHFKGKG